MKISCFCILSPRRSKVKVGRSPYSCLPSNRSCSGSSCRRRGGSSPSSSASWMPRTLNWNWTETRKYFHFFQDWEWEYLALIQAELSAVCFRLVEESGVGVGVGLVIEGLAGDTEVRFKVEKSSYSFLNSFLGPEVTVKESSGKKAAPNSSTI